MRCGQQNGNQQGMEKLSGLGIVGNQYHCQGWRTRGGSQDWSCMRGTATGTERQSELWPQEERGHCQSTARKRGSRWTHFLHPLSPPNSWSLASDSYWPNLIRSQRVGSPGRHCLQNSASWDREPGGKGYRLDLESHQRTAWDCFSKLGISKQQPMGQIWPTTCFYKVLLEYIQ